MITRIRKKQILTWQSRPYAMTYWKNYDYSFFKDIVIRHKSNKEKTSYADLIIMADTETSRKTEKPVTERDHHNHVCAWSCAFRSLGMNIVTLWGKSPDELPEMLETVKKSIGCMEMYVYFHNLPYDWTFLRKFFLKRYGNPESQLNVKPLYPINIKFENGIFLKDSLILAQRSLEKWGNDLHVEHAKAVGKWDYDKIRNADDWEPDEDELSYMECDVLCGVECIDNTLKGIKKTIGSIPMTATGIVRGECRNEGRKHKAHDWLLQVMPVLYEIQQIFEKAFHGGYTHANRHILGETFPGILNTLLMGLFIICKDFSSSYPFCLLAFMYPSERFWRPKRKKFTAEYVLNNKEEYAFLIKFCAWGIHLKDPRFPMPALSLSKCEIDVNSITDNGRILKADYVEIWMTEVDFELIWKYYECTPTPEHPNGYEIPDLLCSRKKWLPKWFTDYVYQRYANKTTLKGGDPVLYAIEKAKANSIYGMAAQRPVKEDIRELYVDEVIGGELHKAGEFVQDENFDHESAYQKYLKNRNSFLPYFIGVWCTSYAQRNLFTLGECVGKNDIWLYSDTDSVYATGFDEGKINAYNENCKKLLRDRGYGAVMHEGKEYWLGVAEDDGMYMQFRTLHSKCYCTRPVHYDKKNKQYATMPGEHGFVMGDPLKITVAGVPKKGSKCLENDIRNFATHFVFDGEVSGKLQHTHWLVDEIYKDAHGNLTGDSIELSKCDYMLSGPGEVNFNELDEDVISIINYEDDMEE